MNNQIATRLCRHLPLLFACLLLCAASIGCSFGANNPNVRNSLDMLRVERDAAEDQYYALKQKHDEAIWKIEDLESQLKSIQEKSTAAPASYQNREWAEDYDGSVSTTLDEGNQGETVEEPGSIDSNWMSPSRMPREQVGPPTKRIRETQRGAGPRSEVSYVDIDAQMTRGFDSHGKSGDDGIVVAIKPMTESDEFVAIAAPVTIALNDPSRSGIRKRVGLWKFSAEQVANRIDHENKVFLFRLPWQRTAPVNPNLKLYVRFLADDGNRETEMDMTVMLDGAPRSKWTTVTQSETAEVDLVTEPKRVGSQPAKETELSEKPESRIARPEWSPIR